MARQRLTYDIIFDDDDSGEAADVVAVGMNHTDVCIDLFHCKFSSEDKAGARVGDLYEVCGQAARSVRWVGSPGKLLEHLLAREKSGTKKGIQRFVKGDRRQLKRYSLLLAKHRVTYRIFAVQPGLSKMKVASERKVQDILAATDTYLRQTAEFGLRIICSP